MISRRNGVSVEDTDGSNQTVRVAGTLHHAGRAFTLALPSGVRVRGRTVYDAGLAALDAFQGKPVLVSGRARFRQSGFLLHIEAQRVERAAERDLVLWGTVPLLGFGPLDRRSLRQSQGPRSGVAAMFGKLPDEESDQDVIEALERLS